MKDFKNKVALITGAGSGLGKELAIEAHKRGMRLFLADINEETVSQTVMEIRKTGGIAEYCVTDVSSEDGVNKMIDEAMSKYGQIDLLINNAGIARGGSIVDLPARDWEWCIHVNCLSQVYAMKRVIPIMNAQKTPCHIVNMASSAGLITIERMPAYAATKHFVVGLSESICYDLQSEKSKIKISVICPGFMKTNLYKSEERRPERFKDSEDPFYKSEKFSKLEKNTKKFINQGESLDGFGKFVFDEIEKDKFYILPHKSIKTVIQHRLNNIVKERTPNLDFYRAAYKFGEGDKSLKNLLTILKLK